ncbi:phosphoribosyltransferase [Biomaibacter acetigenes]|uniref:Phosphoribosyltransferase n=1 Tax=Biomaibacter acetigenes TaxID=2316383 RepID=A0A3G2R8F2_9FIRM|nr:phosphoribosyltransferase family protein [Biomaibacter acetigenes]AYO31328.1 phosphoribosyltransferase [Biomaibacter acetigenes]
MFKDREDAARQLAMLLEKYRDNEDVVVFAIPRGGVVIGRVIADYLNVPLDITVAKKIGAPFNEELAIGAVGPTGNPIIDERTVNILHIDEGYMERAIRKKVDEIRARLEKYRGNAYYRSLLGKKAILVDDGIATGYTVRAAIAFLKDLKAGKIILATPVIAPDTWAELKPQVDEVVYLSSEEPFYAVGQFYEEFGQVTDEEVIKLLNS